MSYWLFSSPFLKYVDFMLRQSSSKKVRNTTNSSQLMLFRVVDFQDGCQGACYITWDLHIAQDAPTSVSQLHSHNKWAGRMAGLSFFVHSLLMERDLIMNEQRQKEGKREGPLESHTHNLRQAQFPWLIKTAIKTCYRLLLETKHSRTLYHTHINGCEFILSPHVWKQIATEQSYLNSPFSRSLKFWWEDFCPYSNLFRITILLYYRTILQSYFLQAQHLSSFILPSINQSLFCSSLVTG